MEKTERHISRRFLIIMDVGDLEHVCKVSRVPRLCTTVARSVASCELYSYKL